MLNKSAISLVRLLEKHYKISHEERSIYIYGFELLLSTLSSMTSILIMSLLINKISYAISFFVVFFVLRLFSGGYHANTYLKCFITTNTIFISTILLTKLSLLFQVEWIMPTLVIISTVIIWLFSPIKNQNHPCSEKTYIKNKKRSRILSLLYSIVFFYIYYFTSLKEIAIHSAWSLIIVSIMIIIEKLILTKEVENSEYYQFNDC